MKHIKSYNEALFSKTIRHDGNDWTSDTMIDRLPDKLKKTVKNFKSFFNNENDKIKSYTNILKDWRYSYDIEFNNQKYIYTFKVNDDLIEIHVLNSKTNDIKLRINEKEVNISTKICRDFLNELRRINKSTYYFTNFIKDKFKNHITASLLSEVDERLVEFEVIKDGKIDLISLNQLYDFYNIPFDENKLDQRYYKN